MMRRMIFGSLVAAATIGAPSLAMAAPAANPVQQEQPQTTPDLRRNVNNPKLQPQNGMSTQSLGGGMQGGNESGHVTGPGNAPIDNSTRGPINDVQPGQGTNDTRQSRNPKPVQ